jgi:hypothetical protein
MHLAQLVEVKGDITLEAVQVYGGGMGGFGGMGGSMGMGGGMGFPNMPNMGVNVSYGQPPQSSFGGFSAGFGGFPSAPVVNVIQTPNYAVRFSCFCFTNSLFR